MTTSNSSAEVNQPVNMITKFFANLVSYLFHPVFIPLYVTYFLVYVHPYVFVGFSDHNKGNTLLIVALNLVFFPLVAVLLLKAVGFIESIYLRTQKDRIIPYIASGIFFFWTYTVFKEQHLYPLVLVIYVFGIFLASSFALLANIYCKVSMHTIGMGGWIGLFLFIMYSNTMLMTWPLCIVFVLSGLVGTARLLLKSHTAFEVYAGYAIGIVSQLIAAYFLSR